MTAKPRDDEIEQFSSAVETLKLLADLTRLRIIWALLHGEQSVNELASHVDANKAAVSQHLSKLRLARLVTTRREGTRIFYSAANDHILRLVEEAIFHADHLADKNLHRHRRSEKPA